MIRLYISEYKPDAPQPFWKMLSFDDLCIISLLSVIMRSIYDPLAFKQQDPHNCQTAATYEFLIKHKIFKQDSLVLNNDNKTSTDTKK